MKIVVDLRIVEDRFGQHLQMKTAELNYGYVSPSYFTDETDWIPVPVFTHISADTFTLQED